MFLCMFEAQHTPLLTYGRKVTDPWILQTSHSSWCKHRWLQDKLSRSVISHAVFLNPDTKEVFIFFFLHKCNMSRDFFSNITANLFRSPNFLNPTPHAYSATKHTIR